MISASVFVILTSHIAGVPSTISALVFVFKILKSIKGILSDISLPSSAPTLLFLPFFSLIMELSNEIPSSLGFGECQVDIFFIQVDCITLLPISGITAIGSSPKGITKNHGLVGL